MSWDNRDADFSELLGETLVEISGLEVGSEDVRFKTASGKQYVMHHYDECCETVSVEDISGEAGDLIGSPLVQAEEASSGENPPGVTPKYQDSFTWTFYKLGTAKGFVTIRWYGESNGYYSEDVDFEEVTE